MLRSNALCLLIPLALAAPALAQSDAKRALEEARALSAYLRRNAQRPINPKRYPELELPEGRSFKLACPQCHVLPDPRRHTAAEWPRVVARMQKNMQWMNRVVGTRFDPDEPQLRVEEINAFLARYARRE